MHTTSRYCDETPLIGVFFCELFFCARGVKRKVAKEACYQNGCNMTPTKILRSKGRSFSGRRDVDPYNVRFAFARPLAKSCHRGLKLKILAEQTASFGCRHCLPARAAHHPKWSRRLVLKSWYKATTYRCNTVRCIYEYRETKKQPVILSEAEIFVGEARRAEKIKAASPPQGSIMDNQ